MIKSIGETPWTNEDLVRALEEFSHIYARCPIKKEEGSMRPPHLFLAWFVLKWLDPKVIVESGVLWGRGTWFFEQACPNAQFYCIDIVLDRIRYKPENATYLGTDFSHHDWSHLPRETVLFFDDHQNAFQRVKLAQRWGLSHLMFEDNYPGITGDCYSLKRVFAHAGLPLKGIEPNAEDARYLEQCLEIYCELPPVFDPVFANAEREYLRPFTAEPLLDSLTEPWQEIYLNYAHYYWWLCYAKIKET